MRACSIGAVLRWGHARGRGARSRTGWSRRTGRPRLATAAIAFTLAALGLAPGCTVLQPEVGERLAACVDGDSNPAVKVSFKDQLRPLIDGRVPGPKPCANCHYHSRGTQEGLIETGFDLETLATLKKGGRRTFDDVVVPGQPCKSAIVQKLRGTYEGGRMPKGGPFWTPEEVQLMIDWIAEGAEGANEE
jgi:hypothetical protein